MKLRRAQPDDARMLFDWRNDPLTRAASHRQDVVSYDDHLTWMAAVLADPARSLFVAEADGRPVGTVRVEQDEDGSILLSWTVAPEARGQGAGKAMVAMAVAQLGTWRTVRAQVRAWNLASVRVAEAAGLRLSGRDGDILHFRRDPREGEDE